MGIERRRNVAMRMLLVGVCLNWVCILVSCGDETGDQRDGFDSHIIEVNSLFFPSSSSSCLLSPKPKGKARSSLHVVHAHGACAHHLSGLSGAASPDRAEILRRDRTRVASIHARTSTAGVQRSNTAELPAKDGSTIGSANYIVTVGIGTPTKNVSLVFDSGSDLTWTQCEPCVEACYTQKEPIFNPSSSSSYLNVSCSSPECAAVFSATGNTGCESSTCVYGIQYGDRSYSVGYLASEKITLTTSDVFHGIYFGCGQINKGLFNGAAGLLGLGRHNLSFPSQTASRYKKVFSYCLPSSASSTGHLTFGSAGISRSVKYTPLSSAADRTSLYGIDIVGISVGGRRLTVPSTVFSTAGAIIDSGTVITRLPPKAYAALRSAFQAKMSKYPKAPPVSILDTCYNISGYKTVKFPKIGFIFGGGVKVNVDATGVLYPLTLGKACLAFAGNAEENSVAIFGNVQQQTLEVVYDGSGGRIGFAPKGCN